MPLGWVMLGLNVPVASGSGEGQPSRLDIGVSPPQLWPGKLPMWKSGKLVPFLLVVQYADEKGGQAAPPGAELRR